MKILTVLLCLLFIYSVVCDVEFVYDLAGCKTYNVYPLNQEQNDFVNQLKLGIKGIDFWQHGSSLGREARIMVPSGSQPVFERALDLAKISYEVIIKDVKTTLEEEMKTNEMARAKARKENNSTIGFTAYHRYDEINAYIDEIGAKYPDLVTVRTLGQSSEDRDIKALIISTTGGSDTKKPVIIADAGIHGAEWIGPAQALYMIRKLVEDVTESDVVNDVDWVIIPLLNPDGYEYAHTKFRIWRKTRSTTASPTCLGVDGNRNFEFQWMVAGASDNPCSYLYAGLHPFSEPEVGYLRDIFEEYKTRAKAFWAIHSYGSYVLYPYSYDANPTEDDDELHSLGVSIADAIDKASVSGSVKYVVGNAAEVLDYLNSGVSDDYAYEVGKIKLSYTLELPAGGVLGFDLPPSRIAQVVKETWEGIVVLARYVKYQYAGKI